ncbi:hypothetical protein [Ktedonobacter racemifer]|uniref:hypothetical protein n=1 Tax=Ktedonobacter racemifer TaxID=363277 RepID=UPI0012FC28AD|nr:hypothetical protein [Ktedonobacter racemifer]
MFKEHGQEQVADIAAALFDVDDERVTRLILEKVVVSTMADEGVVVDITWA